MNGKYAGDDIGPSDPNDPADEDESGYSYSYENWQKKYKK